MRRLALLAALLCPASASAAYTPSATIELSDRSPGAVPAVTSRLTTHTDQSATKAIASRFPSAFTYNPDFNVPGCTSADEQAGTCPEASRIGEVSARSPFGNGEGPVHVMTDLRIVAFIRAYAGLAEFRSTGTVTALDDGSFEILFTGLPDLPSSGGHISLEGGSKGLLVNPRRCGSYPVGVRFESHRGEKAEQELPVMIEGCAAELELHRVRLAGRVLTWTVSEPAVTEVTILRRGPRAWREVGFKRVHGTKVTLRGLRRGHYRAVLRALATDGRASRARAVSFRVPLR